MTRVDTAGTLIDICLGKVSKTVIANTEMQTCFEIGTHSLSVYLPRMPKSNGISYR